MLSPERIKKIARQLAALEERKGGKDETIYVWNDPITKEVQSAPQPPAGADLTDWIHIVCDPDKNV